MPRPDDLVNAPEHLNREVGAADGQHLPRRVRPWEDVWLWAALALGFGLRVWGLSYGLPDVYNPDEVAIMSRALALANNGLNPGNFVYPSFFFYVLAGAVGVNAVTQLATGHVSSLAEFEAAFWNDPSSIYLTGRAVSVAAGLATIVTTYLLGSLVGGRTTARVAAVLYAVSYIPVREAHFIKHDVPTTLIVTIVALASHRLWRTGAARDVALAGAAAGLALATHYYAVFACLIVAVALWLRVAEERENRHVAGVGDAAKRGLASQVAALLTDRRSWLAAAAFGCAFAVLSPFVLIDWQTAWRDITANRAILVDRTRATFGSFGALDEHLRILVGQGTGPLFFLVAAAGSAWLAVTRARLAAWLLAFPVVFLMFLANTWPFGRTANVVYPFLAVACAFGLVEVARRVPSRARSVALVAGTLACAASPLVSVLQMNRLMSVDDTRTLAAAWLAEHAPEGTGVAVEPYSVHLEPTREWLADVVTANRGSVTRGGYRVQTWLARDPYPRPAYRVFHIGVGGLDEDKRYVTTGELADPTTLARLKAQGLSLLVLKRLTTESANAVGPSLTASASLVQTITPFARGQRGSVILPHEDVAPSWGVMHPGPILEVWRLH